MNSEISENIKAKVKQDFLDSEQSAVIEEFEKLGRYFDEWEDEEFFVSNENERIYLGILKLSAGKISDFHDAVKEAKSDWRNVLYWNEMSEENKEM